jgi:hypothetical protein
LVVMNLGAAHAVVDIEEKLDVEGGVMLTGLGRQGRGGRFSQLARLAGPVLAGDPGLRYSSHVGEACGYLLRTARSEISVGENSCIVEMSFDRRADALNFSEVIAGLIGFSPPAW